MSADDQAQRPRSNTQDSRADDMSTTGGGAPAHADQDAATHTGDDATDQTDGTFENDEDDQEDDEEDAGAADTTGVPPLGGGRFLRGENENGMVVIAYDLDTKKLKAHGLTRGTAYRALGSVLRDNHFRRAQWSVWTGRTSLQRAREVALSLPARLDWFSYCVKGLAVFVCPPSFDMTERVKAINFNVPPPQPPAPGTLLAHFARDGGD